MARKKRFSMKRAMASSNRAIARIHRLRKKNPKDKRYKAKRKTRSDKGAGRKRKSASRKGGKRGPKKGYKQSAAHIKARIASRRKGKGWGKRSRRKRA